MVNNSINNAYNKARKIYNETFTDTCTIKTFEKQVIDGLTKTVQKTLYANKKCLLKIRYSIFAIQDGLYGFNNTEKVLMLEYQNEPIPNNSYVEVVKDNEIFKFKNSKCINFNTHTLLILKEYEDKT